MDYPTFARRQEVPSTLLSSLTVCGWKEDKICSALFSAREDSSAEWFVSSCLEKQK